MKSPKPTQRQFDAEVLGALMSRKHPSSKVSVSALRSHMRDKLHCDQASFHRMLKKLAKEEHIGLAGVRTTERKPGKTFIRPRSSVYLTAAGINAASTLTKN